MVGLRFKLKLPLSLQGGVGLVELCDPFDLVTMGFCASDLECGLDVSQNTFIPDRMILVERSSLLLLALSYEGACSQSHTVTCPRPLASQGLCGPGQCLFCFPSGETLEAVTLCCVSDQLLSLSQLIKAVVCG